MNCGMEDCIVLNDCFESEGSISAALDKYTKVRNPDAEAMCDLALYNYIEVMFIFIKVLVLDTLLTFCKNCKINYLCRLFGCNKKWSWLM